jgi:vacuolar protein-sorting-associated protein 4
MLFELAREKSPSIILIDEMDSLGRKRNGNESETERRIKTEFLRQMDGKDIILFILGLETMEESVSVFATTNMPWELDIAALRRFQRKVLVPMPNKEERVEIFKIHAGDQGQLSSKELLTLAEMTHG